MSQRFLRAIEQQRLASSTSLADMAAAAVPPM